MHCSGDEKDVLLKTWFKSQKQKKKIQVPEIASQAV